MNYFNWSFSIYGWRSPPGQEGAWLSAIGRNILSFAVAFIWILVGILLGGVVSGHLGQVFNDLNVSSTWLNLKTTAENYIATAMTLTFIGLILAGVVIIIAVVRGGLGEQT